jgi:hypothetical protein
VEQVLGQDASRALNQDNNALAPGVRQELQFIAGDKIYMNIRLKRPAVTVSNVSQQSAPAATLFPDDVSADVNYCLEITLEEKTGAAFPPAFSLSATSAPVTEGATRTLSINSLNLVPGAKSSAITLTSTDAGLNGIYISAIIRHSSFPSWMTKSTMIIGSQGGSWSNNMSIGTYDRFLDNNMVNEGVIDVNGTLQNGGTGWTIQLLSNNGLFDSPVYTITA